MDNGSAGAGPGPDGVQLGDIEPRRENQELPMHLGREGLALPPPPALRRAFRSPLSPSAPLSRDAVESVKAPSSPAAKLQGKIANEYSNTALI